MGGGGGVEASFERSVIPPTLGMSKNGGSGCDGCPYLVMSQTVSARTRHYHTAGEAASPLSFHLSPAVPIQPSISVSISLCHLALTPKFIYAHFLSFSLSPRSLFCLSISFSLPLSPSSPLDGYHVSLLFFSFTPFNKGFPGLTAVLQLYVVFPRLQMENLWPSKTGVVCEQSYLTSSSLCHQHWF